MAIVGELWDWSIGHGPREEWARLWTMFYSEYSKYLHHIVNMDVGNLPFHLVPLMRADVGTDCFRRTEWEIPLPVEHGDCELWNKCYAMAVGGGMRLFTLTQKLRRGSSRDAYALNLRTIVRQKRKVRNELWGKIRNHPAVQLMAWAVAREMWLRHAPQWLLERYPELHYLPAHAPAWTGKVARAMAWYPELAGMHGRGIPDYGEFKIRDNAWSLEHWHSGRGQFKCDLDHLYQCSRRVDGFCLNNLPMRINTRRPGTMWNSAIVDTDALVEKARVDDYIEPGMGRLHSVFLDV